MFWKNEYTTSLKIVDDLQREDITLKELLEEHDILQEFRSQNKSLIEFFKRDDILEELIHLITVEPPNDKPEMERYRYSNIASEILTSNQPSLTRQLIVRQNIIEKLYAFLEQDAPLNPLLSSFFSKTFGMLISKQPEQDWFSYQCDCLQVLEFIKNRPGFLDAMYKHIGTPAIMDLLYHIVTDVKGVEAQQTLFEWLRQQELINRLIDILGNDCDTDKHTNVAQLLCDLIQTGRTERQNCLQEPTSDESMVSDILINALEDEAITRYLLNIILSPTAKESTIISGIQILLKLLENPIINEPVSDTALQYLVDAENDHHKKVIANILQQISPKIKDFHTLLITPPKKPHIQTTVALLSPPFGITRLCVCTLFTVLIETKNTLIIQSICETDFFNTLLNLFKQYCWNNLLHNQVKKCVMCALKTFDQIDGSSNFIPSALQKHIIVNCKIVSKLIDCWMHNKNETSSDSKKSFRLGYMGHLIEMFDLLVSNMLTSDQFRALVESSINIVDADANADADANVVDNINADSNAQINDAWKIITDLPNGELAAELKIQNQFLANIDPKNSRSYMQREYQDDTFLSDYSNETETNLQNSIDDIANSLYRSNLFEEACNTRTFGSFNMNETDSWDLNPVYSIDRDDSKTEFDNLPESSGCVAGDEQTIQIFNQWDIQNSISAINDTNWATSWEFADFDKHLDDFQPAYFPKIDHHSNSIQNSHLVVGNNNGQQHHHHNPMQYSSNNINLTFDDDYDDDDDDNNNDSNNDFFNGKDLVFNRTPTTSASTTTNLNGFDDDIDRNEFSNLTSQISTTSIVTTTKTGDMMDSSVTAAATIATTTTTTTNTTTDANHDQMPSTTTMTQTTLSAFDTLNDDKNDPIIETAPINIIKKEGENENEKDEETDRMNLIQNSHDAKQQLTEQQQSSRNVDDLIKTVAFNADNGHSQLSPQSSSSSSSSSTVEQFSKLFTTDVVPTQLLYALNLKLPPQLEEQQQEQQQQQQPSTVSTSSTSTSSSSATE